MFYCAIVYFHGMDKLTHIKALATDVDGVLTDGTICYGDNGVEYKCFSSRDGLIIKVLEQSGIPVGIITGRQSAMVDRRATELGVSFVAQAAQDKAVQLTAFCKQVGVKPSEVIYIGDDWNDWPAMAMAGFVACPRDAAAGIQARADYIIPVDGGKGVIRGFVEYWQGPSFGAKYLSPAIDV